MNQRLTILLLAAVAAPAWAAAQETQESDRICLAPASAKALSGSTSSLVDAVREAFTGFLTGPTLSVVPLQAKLMSQVRQEAKRASCPYLLLTTVEHKRKQGGSLLGRAAGGAIYHGAWRAGSAIGSGVGSVAATAAAGAAGAAATDLAQSVRTKDEMSLTYRLEAPDGKALVEKKTKRKAASEGEDLLTPQVEQASSAIAEAVSKHSH